MGLYNPLLCHHGLCFCGYMPISSERGQEMDTLDLIHISDEQSYMLHKSTLHDWLYLLSAFPTSANISAELFSHIHNLVFYISNAGENTWHLSAASTSFLRGDNGSIACTIPMLPRQNAMGHKACRGPRAEKTGPKGFQYPKMTKKPRFWWRTLACLPYVMPLHEPWMYAQTAYQLHPFLQTYQYLTYPFLGALGRLPNWFLLAYFFTGYLGVVRRKEWPHFFRFHVVTGMLLEILLQVVGIVYRWLPSGFYWGKIGMHFWTVIAFGYLFTVLECIRCALSGMYADIPFVSSAAYIQIPVDQSGPQD